MGGMGGTPPFNEFFEKPRIKADALPWGTPLKSKALHMKTKPSIEK